MDQKVVEYSREEGFHLSRFSRDSPGFMGFKKLSPSAPQNSVRDAKIPVFHKP
jgi:hypothetical protein